MVHVHRAERADALVAALRELLADPLSDPFAPELIAVPTRGMERWLTQRLSGGLGTSLGRADGVCANVDFPFPRRFMRDAIAAASGIDPDHDRWQPERLVWPLLEVVEDALDAPWLATLATHLGAGAADDPARRARRFSAVRHLASLFDAYALHRPAMVRGWAAGEDDRWQAELWRRLRAVVDQPSPAERLAGGVQRLREDPTLVDAPARVSLFGLTRLPVADLEILRGLAAGRDVHLFLLHPSPALRASVAEAVAGRPPIVRRADDATAALPENRLLASWGHDAREMQVVLGGGDYVDHHHAIDAGGDSLLAQIQAGVRGDRPPSADGERPLLAPDDRTIEVHACHGRARQVEVLRDAVLHLLEEDATLQPRDVIVMCPDIETFAPLIQATFGSGDVAPVDDEPDSRLPRQPDLRVKLADRSLRQTNPVLGVVAQLLDLAPGRLTASQVLDLADREPVRRRFRLDDDDLARLVEWVSRSGIRWGLDAAHRKPFKLGSLDAGTWRKGLDRVLLGVTMTEEGSRRFGDVLPLDDVESGAIDLAGRFAELIDRLHAAIDALGGPQPIGAWAAALADAVDALTETAPLQDWQRVELQRVLGDVTDEARIGAGAGVALSLSEVRSLLAERLRGRPTRANFRTGHLTICTLVPMRSVPHRVVCLLGLDDDVFPRKAPRDGDDLMLDDPHVGERDARTEDRQLLLDAVLAATDRLVVTYTGNDERTNAPRPPAVPVGELLDAVDRTMRVPDGRPRDRVVVRHPLQPFAPRNFDPGALAGDASWSFDEVTLAGARLLTVHRPPPGPFLPAELPPVTNPVVELDDLIRFVERPVRAFLRQRLGISVADYSEEVEDALPVELDRLERWGVGERLVKALLSGVEPRTAALAEIARGALPPGVLGQPVIAAVLPEAQDIVAWAERLLGPATDLGSLDVRVTLADGRIVSGTVPGIVGQVQRLVTYSHVNPRQRLAAWVRLLVLSAAYPDRGLEAATVGRGRARRHRVTLARLPALGAEAARGALEDLIALYDRGMRGPLPIASATSAAYAEADAGGGDARDAARRKWESGKFDGEDRDPEHVLVLGGEKIFDELAEDGRFAHYAHRLWDGLLAHEQLEDR